MFGIRNSNQVNAFYHNSVYNDNKINNRKTECVMSTCYVPNSKCFTYIKS